MVFFNQVADLGAAEEKLVYENVPAIGLASDQSKQLRKLAIDQFKAERVKLLLTTDIAARGLDFTGVPYVVNVDVPLTEELYSSFWSRWPDGCTRGSDYVYQRWHQKGLSTFDETIGHSLSGNLLYDGALHEQPKAKDELEKNESKIRIQKKSTKERKPETVNSVVKEPQETRKKKKNKKKNRSSGRKAKK